MKQSSAHVRVRITWPMALFTLACGCILLSLLRLYASHLGALAVVMLVGPAALGAAGIVLFYTELPRQAEFRLLICVLGVLFLSSAVNEKFYHAFLQNQSDLIVVAALLFVCYALCFALPSERRAGALAALIDGSAAVVALVALVGVILAACNTYVRPAFLPEYGIGLCPENVVMGADGRLTLFTHPNSVGMICQVVLLLNVYRVLTTRRAVVRWLHVVSALICYAALALAASRTASLATAGGLGLYAFRFVLLRTERLFSGRRAPRLAVAAAAMLAVAAVAFLLSSRLCELLLSFAPEGASSAARVTAAERDLLADMGNFTGRTNLWKGALQAMCETPRTFFIGTSPAAVGKAVSSYTPIYAQELHNSFVQMLVSGGVPCILLFLAFLALLAARCAKLFCAEPTPLCGAHTDGDGGWLGIPIAAILVSACMETFLLVYSQLVFASVWFFILSGYVVCTARTAAIESIR